MVEAGRLGKSFWAMWVRNPTASRKKCHSKDGKCSHSNALAMLKLTQRVSECVTSRFSYCTGGAKTFFALHKQPKKVAPEGAEGPLTGQLQLSAGPAI